MPIEAGAFHLHVLLPPQMQTELYVARDAAVQGAGRGERSGEGEGEKSVKHLGDVTKISGYEIEPVDVLTGGSPCQDLSVAGLRKGLKHEELDDEETTRSGLFMEQIRIAKEMRERDRLFGRTGVDVRCRYFVWENVCGAYSSNGGRDFQTVLTEIIRVADPEAPDIPLPEGG